MIWLLVAVLLYAAVIWLVAWVSLHPPRTPVFASPGSFGPHQETVRIEGQAGPLAAWWLPGEDEDRAVVFVHGYCMNRAEFAAEAFFLRQLGWSVLLIDLRGHGRSARALCGFGWREKQDVATAVAWLRKRHSGKVFLVGSSMGAAASAFAAAEDPKLADGLVLDSAYGRLAGAILGWWRFLGGKPLMYALFPTSVLAIPLARLNPFRITVTDACRRIQIPTLVLHGAGDSLALPPEAEANYAALAGPKKLVFFDRCGHSEARWEKPAEYRKQLLDWLEKI